MFIRLVWKTSSDKSQVHIWSFAYGETSILMLYIMFYCIWCFHIINNMLKKYEVRPLLNSSNCLTGAFCKRHIWTHCA